MNRIDPTPRLIADTKPDPRLQPWSVRQPNWKRLGFGSRTEAEGRN
jgi:hypothetical protein